MGGYEQYIVRVLDADPDLAEDLAPDEFESARRRALARVRDLPVGAWSVSPEEFDRGGNLGLLLIEGLLIREVTVGDYTCAELLGHGDVLQPWIRIGPDRSVATDVDWEVVEPARIAILDRDFVL